MFLLFIIPVICFCISFNHLFCKPLIRLLCRPSKEEEELRASIAAINDELSKLSMKDDYIIYVKKERKIRAAQADLAELTKRKTTNNLMLNYGISYGSQIVLAVSLMVISFMYRSVPVIVFSDKFDFTPFNALMRFPTGIRGAVSVPFWIFVNSFIYKGLAAYFNYIINNVSL